MALGIDLWNNISHLNVRRRCCSLVISCFSELVSGIVMSVQVVGCCKGESPALPTYWILLIKILTSFYN